jgi:hypothetical protein
MNEFVIHSIPGSPFGRAVLVALEEKGVPYRFNHVGARCGDGEGRVRSSAPNGASGWSADELTTPVARVIAC